MCTLLADGDCWLPVDRQTCGNTTRPSLVCRPTDSISAGYWQRRCPPRRSPTAKLRFHMRSWHALQSLADSVDHSIVMWPSFAALHGSPAPPGKYTWSLVGPQIPADAVDTADHQAGEPDQAMEYLDAALAEQGERSVLYVAFGTLFFPPSSHQLGLLLSATQQAGLKVLMVQSAAMGPESAQVIEPYVQSGKVLLVPWVDQPRVLKHEVGAGVHRRMISLNLSDAALDGRSS